MMRWWPVQDTASHSGLGDKMPSTMLKLFVGATLFTAVAASYPYASQSTPYFDQEIIFVEAEPVIYR